MKWSFRHKHGGVLARSGEDEDVSTRALVRGSEAHIRRVRRVMWRQAFAAAVLAVSLWGLSAWNDLSGRLGGNSTVSTAIRVEPTSGANVIAVYALLGALLFTLQVSVRSLDHKRDVAEQLEPAELGRRRMVGFLAMVAGVAAFGLAILCLYWYGGFGTARLDLFRVFGPIGASVVLATIAADTFVVTDAPRNSILRRELERQTLFEAKEAYRRMPQMPVEGRPRLTLTRVVFLVVCVTAVSWVSWLLIMWDAPPALSAATTVFALGASLLVCYAAVSVTALFARKEVLEGAGALAMTLLILTLYAAVSWLAFFQTAGQESCSAMYRTALASIALYFGPALLAPLLSLRGFDGARPGILIVLASLRLRRRITAIEKAASLADERVKADPAARARRRLVYIALWLSPLPLVPQLLLRISKVGASPDDGRVARRTAVILSWAFSMAYLAAAVVATISWAT